MTDTERSAATLRKPKQRGIPLAIDDFGSGCSSLTYLRRFAIDKLKIDSALLRHVDTDPDHAAIVQATISMAHSLALEVIAEGVETEAQLAFLRRHQCDQVQDFYVSQPLSAAEVSVHLLRDPLQK